MSKRLLYANVKIPIEISENGTVTPLNEYVDIEFTQCDSLPEPTKTSKHSIFINKLLAFFEPENDVIVEPLVEPESYKLIISEGEIVKKHTKPINSSFKRRVFRHRQTAKNFL